MPLSFLNHKRPSLQHAELYFSIARICLFLLEVQLDIKCVLVEADADQMLVLVNIETFLLRRPLTLMSDH